MKRFLILVAAALALAGCSSSHNTAAGTTTSSSTSTPAGTVTPTSSGAASSTSTVAAPAGPQHCATSQLSARLGNENGAAGTVYLDLYLDNTGTSECYLRGYPGLSFVAGSDGHQVGAPAARAPGSELTVTIAPGTSAVSKFWIVDASNYGTPCGITPVLGLRVYPPNQTSALYVSYPDQACANTRYVTLNVEPVESA